MSILILGGTTCPLCGQIMHERREVVQLPYVAPVEAGDLALLGRQYVHRECWGTWSNHDRYTQAATTLLANNRAQLGRHADVLEAEHVAWYELPGRRGFRFEDLDELVALEVPPGSLCSVADWLAGAGVSESAPDPFVLPAERWTLRYIGRQLRFARERGDEVIEEAMVQPARVRAWARAFRAMCDAAAPA